MKRVMQHELEDMLANYTMNRNMEWIRQDTMEDISDTFTKTLMSISNIKREILNKTDGLNVLIIKGE